MSVQVRGAADVAELRSYLVRGWQPGGVFHRVNDDAQEVARRRGDPDKAMWFRSEAETERIGLQRASLWYVEPEMVDLLLTVRPSAPDDTTPRDLYWPSDSGLMVFAKDVPGVAVHRDEAGEGFRPIVDAAEARYEPTGVRAIMWNRSALPSVDTGQMGLVKCLSVHSYRMLDFDEGLTGDDLKVALELGQIKLGHVDVTAMKSSRPAGTKQMPDGRTATMWELHGQVWAPMGHSDWPIVDSLDTRPSWCGEGSMWESFKEDRQLVTAAFTLLAEEGLASRTVERPPRAAQRRAQRDGVAAPADVTVVTLRTPRAQPHPDHEATPTQHSHRWMVREHLRWARVGKGRTERRLTVVRAHVRGPADAPLVLKEKVNRWVR